MRYTEKVRQYTKEQTEGDTRYDNYYCSLGFWFRDGHHTCGGCIKFIDYKCYNLDDLGDVMK